jgi:alanine-glyoxylate transaminase/serine-glyoxylate transaminase/serine-pyruvate transaminase
MRFSRVATATFVATFMAAVVAAQQAPPGGGQRGAGGQQAAPAPPPMRLMMTPGPSSIDPRVYRALAAPVVGHIDPWFKTCMDETQILMRQIFQTENRVTMPLSASGSGGIEASVLNALEEGDEAIICVNGWFSERMYEIALRTPAKITKVEAPYGKAVDAADVRKAGAGRKIKIVGLAHGETSSGVVTQLDPFRKVADELGALLIVDTVASLAAEPLDVDKQRLDIVFSGSQKALMIPPGLAYCAVSERAWKRMETAKSPRYYFDFRKERKAAAKGALSAAEPILMRTAQKGVIHKRTASRKVSRLAARVRAMA